MTEKKIHKAFTISDFEKEEDFLREQHRNGYELTSYTGLTCYRFKKCEPKDVVYRLDYFGAENGDKETYIQMFRDYGWEYLFDRFGWSYFRKEVKEGEDVEIFSDNQSRLNLVEKVIKTRMLPILIMFLCCMVPQVPNVLFRFELGLKIFWFVLFGLYIYLVIHCGLGLLRLKRKYETAAK